MNACPACVSESIQRALTLTPALEHMTGCYADELDRLTDQLAEAHSNFPARLGEITTAIAEAAQDERFSAYCRHDELFPQSIAELRPEIAVVYAFGTREAFAALSSNETIAVVGARRASAYGREVAYSLANESATLGVTVITGMALGIEGAATRGALQGSTTTHPVVLLAGDCRIPYPRSHHLLHDQVVERGCAISVMPPGVDAIKATFVFRSELLGALADTTVFAEGSEHSGASRTIESALRYGRLVGAVPGPITSLLSDGPNELLSEHKARVIRNATDIWGEHEPPPSSASLGEAEKNVLDAIRHGNSTPDQIVGALPDASAPEVAVALGQLELRGLIARELNTYTPNS